MQPTRASERGLREDATPDEFAAAMVKCQHSLGLCAYTFECDLDGECFRPGAKARARIKTLQREIQALEQEIMEGR